VVVHGAVAAVPLVADATLLVQALGNVIRNAVEAMEEVAEGPRTLTLEVEQRLVRCPDGRRAPRVVFAVEDTGPGIPPQTLARMFNPFFTTRPSGTGLGLAIVHRIVDAHGGHINVRNARGRGARLELCLPPHPVTGSSTTSDGAAPGRPGGASQEGDA
jgi:two-component system sensor histidine kinase HydH